MNDEGREMKAGTAPDATGLLYCGKADFRCGSGCSGCGPDNGCQCQSCRRWCQSNGEKYYDRHRGTVLVGQKGRTAILVRP